MIVDALNECSVNSFMTNYITHILKDDSNSIVKFFVTIRVGILCSICSICSRNKPRNLLKGHVATYCRADRGKLHEVDVKLSATFELIPQWDLTPMTFSTPQIYCPISFKC